MSERVVITPHVIEGYSEACCAIDTIKWMISVGAGGTAEIDVSGLKSDRMVLIINGEDSASNSSVTIKAGNGLQGVTDFCFSVETGKTFGIVPESGRFKNVSGDDKGKMILTVDENSGIKIGAIVLP